MMIRTDYSVFKYLTIAEVDKLWGLYVTGCGTADLPPNTNYPPTKHPDTYMFDWQHGRILPEFQILYITRGKGIFESKPCGKKKVEEGNIILLFPGVWHRYMPERKIGWKEHWVSFNGQQPEKFMDHGLFSPERAVLDIGLNEEIINLYQQIMERIESEKIGYKEIIAALTYQIMALVHSVEKSKKFIGKEMETLIYKSRILMADRIDRKIKFEELAFELGVGYSWFRRMFRQYTSLAPAQYFLQLKLNKAKDLLMSTSLPVKEIAIMTGFDSQFYFSKFFKRRMGMSPQQLREYSRGIS
jgi:AraC-like DNA-binding protein